MKAIQTLGLSKQYGGRMAVDQVNLTVNPGEIFGLLGPNGAGKSTLVKMLVGLVSPSAGSARVLGVPFRQRAARQRMGYLPELFRYQPWLTADEVMTFHQRLLNIPPDRTERESLLARVGLEGRGGDRVRAFSKGLQQRLGLAVAMLGGPKLLFLDEPTSALDPIGRYEVSQLLAALKADGVTIFLNSHLLSDVEKLCDSVALIDRGRILYQGSLENAIYGGVRRYQIRLGDLSHEAAHSLETELPGAVVQWGQAAGQAVLALRIFREGLPDVIQRAMALGARIYEVEPDHSSLEAWFLERMGKGGR